MGVFWQPMGNACRGLVGCLKRFQVYYGVWALQKVRFFEVVDFVGFQVIHDMAYIRFGPVNVAVSCLWHGQQAFKVWLLEQISIKHFFLLRGQMILSLEGCGGYMFFFLWTAIQIFEHTLLKRCAHAGPTAQARTLPTLLVCVCVCFFLCPSSFVCNEGWIWIFTCRFGA